MKHRKSAREKICREQHPRVVPIPESMSRLGSGTMLIPTALEMEALIREIPRGVVVTLGEVRGELARRHQADTTCPLVTGIFWRLVAEAAIEEAKEGVEDVAPYWRVVRDDGSLNERLPGGANHHAALLQEEGHLLLRVRGSERVRVPVERERRPELWLRSSGFMH